MTNQGILLCLMALLVAMPMCSNGFSLVIPPSRTVSSTTSRAPGPKGFRSHSRTRPLFAAGSKRTKRKKITTTDSEPSEPQGVTTPSPPSSAAAVEKVVRMESPAPPKPTSAVESTELKPRPDGPVQLQVFNVRDVVAGRTSSEASSDVNVPSTRRASVAATTPSRLGGGGGSSSTSSRSGSSIKDLLPASSLEQLLEDARSMQQDGSSSSSLIEGSDEEDGSLKAKARQILSTIVTADFFIVMAFLLWFLAGIFASSIIKDDTIQIAFNSK
jgi:hypothetical protein